MCWPLLGPWDPRIRDNLGEKQGHWWPLAEQHSHREGISGEGLIQSLLLDPKMETGNKALTLCPLLPCCMSGQCLSVSGPLHDGGVEMGVNGVRGTCQLPPLTLPKTDINW